MKRWVYAVGWNGKKALYTYQQKGDYYVKKVGSIFPLCFYKKFAWVYLLVVRLHTAATLWGSLQLEIILWRAPQVVLPYRWVWIISQFVLFSADSKPWIWQSLSAMPTGWQTGVQVLFTYPSSFSLAAKGRLWESRTL